MLPTCVRPDDEHHQSTPPMLKVMIQGTAPIEVGVVISNHDQVFVTNHPAFSMIARFGVDRATSALRKTIMTRSEAISDAMMGL